jgi:hypothetical protein
MGDEEYCDNQTAANAIQSKEELFYHVLYAAQIITVDSTGEYAQRSEHRIIYASPQRGAHEGCGTPFKILSRFHNSTPTMALFDVPGWSVPDEPVGVTPKKRRRTHKQNFDKVQSATVNLERLVEQLAPSPAAENTRSDPKEGKSGGVSADGDRPAKKRRRVKKNKSQQSPTPATQDDGTHEASRKKRRKDKRKETSGEKVTATLSPLEPPPEPRSTLTSLQHGMKQSLDGARFRYVIHRSFCAGCRTVLHLFQNPVGGSMRSSTSQTVPMLMP